MNLDSKYWSYCKEIGIMTEKYSKEKALESLKTALIGSKTADPAFKAVVSALTLSSPEVSTRACMLYRYDIDLTYVLGGNIKHGKIADFGQSGVNSSLHITEWSGQGEYTILKDFSSVPYTLYNDKNIFTLDSMKNALKGVIDEQVPKGTTSYESTNWSVSCYVVPVLVALVNFGGKTYQLAYNLQNGYYHWEYPNDPALYAKGKKAGAFNALLKFFGVVLAFIGAATALSKEAYPALLLLIPTLLITWKGRKGKGYYKNYFVKNPDKGMFKPLFGAVVAFICGLLLFAVGYLGL